MEVFIVSTNLHMNLFTEENNTCPNNYYKVFEKIHMECHDKLCTSKSVKFNKKSIQMQMDDYRIT